MIHGIGIDLTLMAKISESIKSAAFRNKVFTPAEIESCEAVANSIERYAGKFAAKEAFMKAIGKGIRQEVWFSQIEVLNHGSGAPYIQVHGEAKRVISALGGVRIHVSISHAGELAVAVVILESKNEP